MINAVFICADIYVLLHDDILLIFVSRDVVEALAGKFIEDIWIFYLYGYIIRRSIALKTLKQKRARRRSNKRMLRDLVRDKLLTIMNTKAYTQFNPEQLLTLEHELKVYMKSGDSALTEGNYFFLMEMLFYVLVYRSQDVDAQVIYNTLRDRLGESSYKMVIMKATLLQINGDDKGAIEFLENLLEEDLEYETNFVTYVSIAKKLIAIKASSKSLNQEAILKELMALTDKFPLDTELWWYASEIYFEMGQFEKTRYCLEQVLCITPFNYACFAKLSETLYYEALRSKKQVKAELLGKALNNALRSVELSELYLKGWALVNVISREMGRSKQDDLVKLSQSKLKEISKKSNNEDKITAKLILNKI
ncbi:EMC2-like protein [Saccharomyces kudriavzevii IFO 1802]|uniref:ER membrane protein complex subunit 2 n=2 Tax=Saccharomyces kudriavzevii (strain ATCC MYA-4449 / AS 2.2408 / CBS 8840 / NBRC 1802 / NCYC 2889) TaxID=226230 RepID=J4TS80_SACK1|nr:EMC2-like protein [Saccharomyces kudriavzevii IFO 1802]